MARELPDVLFLVYGGDEQEVSHCRKIYSDLHNLIFNGHVFHSQAQQIMRCVDVLLMPYQKKVSIGLKSHDTGRWMSPMKMFEYMATGVPIISSDLPVLNEILTNRVNALLVNASDYHEWCKALKDLVDNPSLSISLADSAYKDYKNKYTWSIRAQKILDIIV